MQHKRQTWLQNLDVDEDMVAISLPDFLPCEVELLLQLIYGDGGSRCVLLLLFTIYPLQQLDMGCWRNFGLWY